MKTCLTSQNMRAHACIYLRVVEAAPAHKLIAQLRALWRSQIKAPHDVVQVYHDASGCHCLAPPPPVPSSPPPCLPLSPPSLPSPANPALPGSTDFPSLLHPGTIVPAPSVNSTPALRLIPSPAADVPAVEIVSVYSLSEETPSPAAADMLVSDSISHPAERLATSRAGEFDGPSLMLTVLLISGAVATLIRRLSVVRQSEHAEEQPVHQGAGLYQSLSDSFSSMRSRPCTLLHSLSTTRIQDHDLICWSCLRFRSEAGTALDHDALSLTCRPCP